MILPQTQVATPEWIAAQEISDWLAEAEMIVLKAWASEKRGAEWLAGRLAVKRLLREAYGLSPRDCVVGREGVAPIVPGALPPHIAISLSHSNGLGAASWSDRRSEGTVGVDAQHVRPVHPGLLHRVFTPDERGQIRAHFGAEADAKGQLLFWAVKEAAIKARRVPWERALQDITVMLSAQDAATVHIAGEELIYAQMAWQDGWWLARAARKKTPPGDGTHPGTSADPGEETHPGTSADPPETGGQGGGRHNVLLA